MSDLSFAGADESTNPKGIAPRLTLAEYVEGAMPIARATPPIPSTSPAASAYPIFNAETSIPLEAAVAVTTPTPGAPPPTLLLPNTGAMPNGHAAAAFPYDDLRSLARTLDDLEATRIKVENRLRSSRLAGRLALKHEAEMLSAVIRAEHCAELDLCRMIRTHPLWAAYGKGVRGCGEKLFGRLLAEVGDPYVGSHGHWFKEKVVRDDGETIERRTWVVDDYFVRTVSRLWRYCGLDPTARLTKGATAEDVLRAGKEAARKSLYLISTSMLKSGNRGVYDARREHTTEAHPDWTKGHSHNDALRIVAKEFLKGLWVAARELS